MPAHRDAIARLNNVLGRKSSRKEESRTSTGSTKKANGESPLPGGGEASAATATVSLPAATVIPAATVTAAADDNGKTATAPKAPPSPKAAPTKQHPQAAPKPAAHVNVNDGNAAIPGTSAGQHKPRRTAPASGKATLLRQSSVAFERSGGSGSTLTNTKATPLGRSLSTTFAVAPRRDTAAARGERAAAGADRPRAGGRTRGKGPASPSKTVVHSGERDVSLGSSPDLEAFEWDRALSQSILERQAELASSHSDLAEGERTAPTAPLTASPTNVPTDTVYDWMLLQGERMGPFAKAFEYTDLPEALAYSVGDLKDLGLPANLAVPLHKKLQRLGGGASVAPPPVDAIAALAGEVRELKSAIMGLVSARGGGPPHHDHAALPEASRESGPNGPSVLVTAMLHEEYAGTLLPDTPKMPRWTRTGTEDDLMSVFAKLSMADGESQEELGRRKWTPSDIRTRYITEANLNQALKELNMNLSKQESGRWFYSFDRQAAGKLSFADFKLAATDSVFMRRIVAAVRNPPPKCSAIPADYPYHLSTAEYYMNEDYQVLMGRTTSSVKKYQLAFHGELYGEFQDLRRALDYTYHVNYTEDRTLFQDELVKNVAQRHKPQRWPWVVLTCGPMGAGKGYVLQWLSHTGVFPLDNVVKIDPDFFKAAMPEWPGYVRNDSVTAGTLCHKESGTINELAMCVSLRARQNTWIDGSLQDYMWWAQWILGLRKLYPWYRVAIFYVHCSEAQVLQRAHQRSLITGRHIPQDFLKKSIGATAQAVEHLGPLADFVARIDNSCTESPDPYLELFQDRSHSFRAISDRFRSHADVSMERFPEELGTMWLQPVVSVQVDPHNADAIVGTAGALRIKKPLPDAVWSVLTKSLSPDHPRPERADAAEELEILRTADLDDVRVLVPSLHNARPNGWVLRDEQRRAVDKWQHGADTTGVLSVRDNKLYHLHHGRQLQITLNTAAPKPSLTGFASTAVPLIPVFMLLPQAEFTQDEVSQLQEAGLHLSPMHPTTLDKHSRMVAGIPDRADLFCWCYGLLMYDSTSAAAADKRDEPDSAVKTVSAKDLSKIARARGKEAGELSAIMGLVLHGGFLYFNQASRTLVAANACCPFSTTGEAEGNEGWSYSLAFLGAQPVPRTLDLSHRWVRVVDPAILERGGTSVAWLVPGELPFAPAGGFAFRVKVTAGVERQIIFPLDVQ